MELRIAQATDKDLWDGLVEKTSHGFISHKWDFLAIIEKNTRATLYPLICLKGTTPVGLYPLFLQKKLSVSYVSSPPRNAFLSYMGPLLIDCDGLKQSKRESIFLELQKRADDFVSSDLGCGNLSINTSPGMFDARPFMWAGYSVELLHSFVLDPWSNAFDSPQKDLKDSISLAENTKEVPDSFGKKQLTYLEDIKKSFPSDLRIFSAEGSRGQVALFALLCYHKRAALCAWFSPPGVGDVEKCLVIRDSVLWAREQGFHTYEIMDNKILSENRSFESFFDPCIHVRYRAEKYSTPAWKALNNARGAYN